MTSESTKQTVKEPKKAAEEKEEKRNPDAIDRCLQMHELNKSLIQTTVRGQDPSAGEVRLQKLKQLNDSGIEGF